MKHLARPFTAPALICSRHSCSALRSVPGPAARGHTAHRPPGQARPGSLRPRKPRRPGQPPRPRPGTRRRRTLQEKTAVTRHTIRIGGQPVAYTATAGNLLLRDDRNKPIASFFYVYYTRDGVTDVARRPLFYSFNGGPGSASIWMHVGLHRPTPRATTRRVSSCSRRTRCTTTSSSILDIADIVYIDPIGAGYSRMARARTCAATTGSA